jgi:hypothetical protein
MSLITDAWSSVIAKTLLTGCFAILVIFAVVWYPSEPLRSTLDSSLWSIVIVAIGSLVVSLLGRQNVRILQKILGGPPLFGRLGGMPAHTYETAVRAGRHVKLELNRDDQQWLNSFEDLDKMILEQYLRQRFMTSVAKSDWTEEAKEQEWGRIWKDEILGLKVDNISFEEFAYSGTFGPKIVLPALLRATAFTSIFGGVFTTIMLAFL